jgi:hypothetical protein
MLKKYLLVKIVKSMLTGKQKQFLEEAIYGILKESLFEYNGSNDINNDGQTDKRAKRESVMKWLNSDQSNHAALAYRLYGAENGDEVEQGNARSLFTKKFQGEDAEGKQYSFDDDEITRLYNMKDDYINSMEN